MGGLGFEAPLILTLLVALPVLWFVLRAIPPAPILRRFPGVALLLGLADKESTTDRTPWWLLLLRMLAVGAAIVGFAGPVIAPPGALTPSKGPMLILVDGGWADAPDWKARTTRISDLLDAAKRQGRPVALVSLATPPQPIDFRTGAALAGHAAGLEPQPWLPLHDAAWVKELPAGPFETHWLSDGLDHPGQGLLTAALLGHGPVNVAEGKAPLVALRPPVFNAQAITVTAARPLGGPATRVAVAARGPGPSGTERDLARASFDFAAGAKTAEATFSLPAELRNRVQRFELVGASSAGAVALADDSLKRRKVALISDAMQKEGPELLSPLHYLKEALQPSADIIEGGIMDMLPAKPDVIILSDVARLTAAEEKGLMAWVKQGGMLLRFAGPHMAAADPIKLADDPLMPVKLRGGGTTTGGAMSWGKPKTLAPFPEKSPFHGLAIPSDVRVKTQVLAEPDAELTQRTIASLDDGTPLVTRKAIGQGQVVLFHVTANADWSNLPLSGLFVHMLERLAVSARSGNAAADLAGQTFVPRKVLDGMGQLGDAGKLAGVAGKDLATALQHGPSPEIPPGLYTTSDRSVAVNALGAKMELTPAKWPGEVKLEGFATVKPVRMKGGFLAFALLLALLDILAALWLSGRLGRGAAAALGVALAMSFPQPQAARAQAQSVTIPPGTSPSDARAIEATSGVTLAYVITGDPAVDAVSRAGLKGLGNELAARTAVEPLQPMGVHLKTDVLAFYPLIYWPIIADAPTPDPQTDDKINAFMRNGGMILFDTRDGDGSALAGTSPEARALKRIASGLDIPPLEPIPSDHVLTRTFFLLQRFPGRYVGAPVWVAAAAPNARKAPGMPFRDLNDGVSPVVIGGNDWAAAWAVDGSGAPLLPVGRGMAGEQQREYAYRFGINLVMYALTGNYKSDQVHVPALLQRLGQ